MDERSVEGRANLGSEPHARTPGRGEREPPNAPGHDQARYSESSIDRLVEAGVWKGDRWLELEGGCWLDLRADVERTGNVDSEGWMEVLDVERAVTALRSQHPEAGLAVTAVMLGWSFQDLQEAFREMSRDRKDSETAAKRAELALESGKRFMASWLSGRDAERTYRGFRRHWGRER